MRRILQCLSFSDWCILLHIMSSKVYPCCYVSFIVVKKDLLQKKHVCFIAFQQYRKEDSITCLPSWTFPSMCMLLLTLHVRGEQCRQKCPTGTSGISRHKEGTVEYRGGKREPKLACIRLGWRPWGRWGNSEVGTLNCLLLNGMFSPLKLALWVLSSCFVPF